MSSYEIKYSLLEKLGVAFLFACTKFKHYLLASQFVTLVQCETEGLKLLVQQAHLKGRATRLMAPPQAFGLVIKNTKGTRLSHASLLDLGKSGCGDKAVLLDELECFVMETEPDSCAVRIIGNYKYVNVRSYL